MEGQQNVTCAGCGREFSVEETIEIEGGRSCASCKPLLIQRLLEGAGVGAHGTFRHLKQVVLLPNGELPNRCFACNSGGTQKVRVKLAWHEPWVYLFILLGCMCQVGILLYLIVALIVRRRVTIHLPLCPLHLGRRRIRIAAFITLIVGGLLSLFTSLMLPPDFLPICLTIASVLLAIAVVGSLFGRNVRVAKIEAPKRTFLKGAGAPFLESLPLFVP
jgi:hypothetical protein